MQTKLLKKNQKKVLERDSLAFPIFHSSFYIYYTFATVPLQVRSKSVPMIGRQMGFGRDLQGRCMGIRCIQNKRISDAL